LADCVLHDGIEDTEPVWGTWFAGRGRVRTSRKNEAAEQKCGSEQAGCGPLDSRICPDYADIPTLHNRRPITQEPQGGGTVCTTDSSFIRILFWRGL